MTISGTFTADGVSSVLVLGNTIEDVDFTITGPFDGVVQIERDQGGELSWETLRKYTDHATVSTRYTSKANDRLRVRAIGIKTNYVTALTTAAAWTAGAGWTIATGTATRVAGAATPNLTTTLSGLVPGATYTVTFDMTTTAGSMTVDLGGGTASSALTTADDEVSVDLVAGSTNETLRFIAGATYAGTITAVVVTHSIAYSFADTDAIVDEVRLHENHVLATRTQAGMREHGTFTVDGASTLTGVVTATGGVVGAVTGALNGVPAEDVKTVDASQKFRLFDDFYGTWAIGDAGPADTWSATAGNGAGTQTATTVANSVNGEITLKSSSADGAFTANAVALTGLSLGFKANQGGLSLQTKIKLSDISEAYLFVGFTDAISTTLEQPIFLNTTAIDSDAANACGVLYDVDGTTKQWCQGGVKADADTTPVYSGTAPVDDTYVTVRVEVSAAGAVQGFINGTAIGAAVANAVTITTALTPAIIVANRSANQVVATLDYIDVQQNR
jgi:hypothetical protein